MHWFTYFQNLFYPVKACGSSVGVTGISLLLFIQDIIKLGIHLEKIGKIFIMTRLYSHT